MAYASIAMQAPHILLVSALAIYMFAQVAVSVRTSSFRLVSAVLTSPPFLRAAILRVSSVRFSTIGVAVLVTFNAPTDMGGMIGIDNCSSIISNVGIFGVGPYCVWPNSSVLAIWLGSSATVNVGDLVIFKEGTIKCVASYGGLQQTN